MEALYLSREQVIKYHRGMWIWISKIIKNVNSLTDNFINEVTRLGYGEFNIYSLKRYYIVHILHIDEDTCILNNCFLCEYAGDRAKSNNCAMYIPHCCEYCPLDWGISTGCRCIGEDDGLYAKLEDAFEYGDFRNLENIQDIYETCIEIANLKEIL